MARLGELAALHEQGKEGGITPKGYAAEVAKVTRDLTQQLRQGGKKAKVKQNQSKARQRQQAQWQRGGGPSRRPKACRYGTSCRNDNCRFRHPSGGWVDAPLNAERGVRHGGLLVQKARRRSRK